MAGRRRLSRTLVAGAALAMSVFCGSVSAVADGRSDDRQSRGARATDDRSRALLRTSSSASPTVAALLRDLADADAIVFVQLALTPLDIPGDLQLIGVAGGTRYLVVRISVRLSPLDRIAFLGHELQHAGEVAGAADVRDEAGLARLMARIGWSSSRGRFETRAAESITRQVRSEAMEAGWR